MTTPLDHPPSAPVPDRVALLEDLTLTAWPCLKTVHHDGWVLRFAGGHTGRANSVTVLAPGRLPLSGKLDFVEEAYRAQGLPPMVRFTPLCPAELDGVLAARGYALENASLVQQRDSLDGMAGAWAGAGDPDVAVTTALDPAWVDAYAGMTGLTPDRRAALHAILAAIAPRCFYGAAVVDGAIRAVALAVVDRGHAGLFDVATHPAWRGRGLARRVITTLLARAAAHGAGAAYLQVAAANAPALALYAGLGFRTAYPYHYRRKAPG